MASYKKNISNKHISDKPYDDLEGSGKRQTGVLCNADLPTAGGSLVLGKLDCRPLLTPTNNKTYYYHMPVITFINTSNIDITGEYI